RRHTRCLSDWSSDVCSSDLDIPLRETIRHHPGEAIFPPGPDCSYLKHIDAYYRDFRYMQYKRYLSQINARLERQPSGEPLAEFQIGRASCRERVEDSEGDES